MDLFKAFDCFPKNLQLTKLKKRKKGENRVEYGMKLRGGQLQKYAKLNCVSASFAVHIFSHQKVAKEWRLLLVSDIMVLIPETVLGFAKRSNLSQKYEILYPVTVESIKTFRIG